MLTQLQLSNEVLPLTVQPQSTTNCSSEHMNWNLVSVGSFVCRICHHSDTSSEPLVSPCRCKGTLAHIHLSCLERWLNESSRNHCELCQHIYEAIKTPRYRCFESLRIWLSIERNRHNAQSNIFIIFILTIATASYIAICLNGANNFIIEGKKIGISSLLTRCGIMFFLTIIGLGYCTAVYLLVKEQVVPWYRWWESTVNIRLVVQPGLYQVDDQIQKVVTDKIAV
ncbi:E3 ubiquitin-protein ligase MARCHF3-like [Aphidius gifuensis]|uniref:E3 ubiquitin-protein ligase MARCHF3-like n=1 Tax=Aphidius gifuensis TaxID=684658 RepID=UPI001CDC0963|nr:E3 ubiquitin-protein ligase MARCHF3-like [Aphidius gifuensis]